MSRVFSGWLLLLFFVLGCGSGDDDPSASAGNSGAGAGGESGTSSAAGTGAPSYLPCSDDQRVGGFSLLTVGETMADPPLAAHTEFNGAVLDAVQPNDVWEELDAAEGCRLVVAPSVFCDPGCASSETCASSGCVPTPRTHGVGTVTLTGLASELSLMPSMSSRRYSLAAALVYPPYAEGAQIQLQAEGGDYEPFTLHAVGVPLLELAAGEITVAREAPVMLRWTERSDIGPARVFVELDIAHHGGILARIECEVEDDGELVIPAELVTQLVDRGVAGFPTITVTRRSVDSTTIAPGCVELEVGSQEIREVAIPGLSSCSNERPCPDGQTCQADLTCS